MVVELETSELMGQWEQEIREELAEREADNWIGRDMFGDVTMRHVLSLLDREREAHETTRTVLDFHCPNRWECQHRPFEEERGRSARLVEALRRIAEWKENNPDSAGFWSDGPEQGIARAALESDGQN